MATTTTFDEAFITEFMARWVAVWNDGDIDATMGMLTDDAVMTDPALPKPARGKAEVRAALEGLLHAIPDFHVDAYTVHAALDGSPQLLNHWLASGTFTGPMNPPGFAPTNTRVTFEGASRLRFRGDALSEVHFLYDLMALGRQIGGAPEPGSGPERLGVLMQRLAARRMRRRAAR
jgi:hypothetical protein